MMKISFNNHEQMISSVEELGIAIDRFDREQMFELWIFTHDGPSMMMLRNGTNAWLMYLRHNDGDSGFRSSGDSGLTGVAEYTLGNGQADEYPLAWCINVEQCYKAISFFFVNDGEKPSWIKWLE